MLTLPEHLKEFEEHYSNFDHQMPIGVNKALQDEKFYMKHTAWDHWGTVWFHCGKFHEQVDQYKIHIATISEDTIEEVIEEVNSRYGYG